MTVVAARRDGAEKASNPNGNCTAVWKVGRCYHRSQPYADRLRQPDDLQDTDLISIDFPETHGFASLPRDRLAFIVCNHHLGKNSRTRASTCATELNTFELRLSMPYFWKFICWEEPAENTIDWGQESGQVQFMVVTAILLRVVLLLVAGAENWP